MNSIHPDDEFVAAETRKEVVRANALVNLRHKVLQRSIAKVMAIIVVDPLEIVHVEEHQRAVHVPALKHASHEILQRAPIGNLCQRVQFRNGAQLLLTLALQRDILVDDCRQIAQFRRAAGRNRFIPRNGVDILAQHHCHLTIQQQRQTDDDQFFDNLKDILDVQQAGNAFGFHHQPFFRPLHYTGLKIIQFFINFVFIAVIFLPMHNLLGQRFLFVVRKLTFFQRQRILLHLNRCGSDRSPRRRHQRKSMNLPFGQRVG